MTWGKLAAGGALIVMFIGAVFWAGAAYARFGGMELHLSSIDAQLGHIADVQNQLVMLQDGQREHERRINALEAYLKRNP